MKTTNEIFKVTKCRVCRSSAFTRVFSLGLTPLANAFLREKDLDTPEKYYPLELVLCNSCTLLQLAHVVNPEILFSKYLYVSSTSPVFVKHFKDFAGHATEKFSLIPKKDLIVDIGSNDGILLMPFKQLGLKVIGIEPASAIASFARQKLIPTVNSFLSRKVAADIRKKYGPAKLVTMTNVFAHIHDLDEVLESVKILLDKDGVAMIEAPYMLDFLRTKSFDLIYHEHLSYWALKPLEVLLSRFGFKVLDAEHVPVHGGSMRVYFTQSSKLRNNTVALDSWRATEIKEFLTDPNTYRKFFKGILKNRMELLSLLTGLKEKNNTIIGFGAPAKSTTLMTFFGIGREYLEYIADDSSLKQGRYTPGTHIPIVSSDRIVKDNPDYMLILAWNFAESIMKRFTDFQQSGGRFIVPVPSPKIL